MTERDPIVQVGKVRKPLPSGDKIPTDSVTDLVDDLAAKATGGGTASGTNTGDKTRAMLGAQLGTGVAASVAASTTVFTTLFAGGTTGVSATEVNKQIPMAYAGTVSNFRVLTTGTQDAGGSLVFTIRKAGSNTAVVVTITAGGAAGVYSDITNSVAFAAGDLLSIGIVNNAAAQSCAFTSFSFQYDTP